MNTLEKRNKETVTEEQIQSARERAGYNSEDLINEVNNVLQKLEEEKQEYLSLNEEQKKKIEDSKGKIINVQDIGDDDILEGDMVNNPSHYQSMSSNVNIDCITAMRAAFGESYVLAFCICNAFKYLFRHQSKGGKTDLLKCKWYIDKYLELYG